MGGPQAHLTLKNDSREQFFSNGQVESTRYCA